MNHHTAVLFNGAALCLILMGGRGCFCLLANLLNGALSATHTRSNITSEKMNHHTAVVF